MKNENLISKEPVARKPGRPFTSFEGASLTRELTISRALEITSEKGLSGLTIQSLAKSLQVSRAPIYAIFPSRQALVEEAIDAVLSEIFFDQTADLQDWRDELRQLALTTLQVYRKYPGVASELVRTGFPDTEAGRRSARFISRLMRRAGAPKRYIPTLIFVTTSMIIGAEMEFTGQDKREAENNDVPDKEGRLANRRGDTLPLEQLNLETFADAIEVILLGMEAFIGRYPEKETD